MAANDYYHSFQPPSHDQHPSSNPHLPEQPYNSYASHTAPIPSPSPYNASPQSPPGDFGYRPYESTTHGSSNPYSSSGGLASGGREHDHNQYADDVPLQPHMGKQGTEHAYPVQYDDDPAVIDRPPPKKRQKKSFLARVPWVVYTLTLIQVVVFIAELAKNGALTKTPIEIHPSFNPMIGPSPYVLINMGARYVPCMRKTEQTLEDISWPCPNTTSADLNDPKNSCHLNNLCGFGDGAYTDKHLPHQWYRFIIPIFLHAGFIHIGFNMMLQLLLGSDMEREIGSVKFIIIYLSSGIFGFVLGGNYAAEGIASTGASGSLFGVIALLLLDLLYHWGERPKLWIDLMWIIIDIAISFALGLLPGLDNFSHIGGFLMGLVLGICLLHSPEILRQRVGADLPPYASVSHARPGDDEAGILSFVKNPMGFFKGRKPLWWAWWLVRAAALIGVLAGFIALLDNFYKENPTKCSWCKYLSCIDHGDWCDQGQLKVQNKTQSPNRKRDFLDLAMPIVLDRFQ